MDHRLEKLYIVGGPVTCVSFLSDDRLLIGKGPYLEVVQSQVHAVVVEPGLSNSVGAEILATTPSSCGETASAQSVIASIEQRTATAKSGNERLIFSNGGTIHGARQTSAGFLIVFGGRQLALLHNETFHTLKVNQKDVLHVSDWIWDARLHQKSFQDGNGEGLLALGLANNTCEVWKLRTETSTSFSAIRQHCCGNQIQCITYCMAMNGWSKSTGSLIIASGTVWNEILLWNVEESDTTTTDRPVTFILKGHEGVILSLKFNKEGNLLASTSDDRSVRLWSILHGSEGALLWVAWGHTARVWDVAFSASHGIVSSGEDGTARLWDVHDGHERAIFRNYVSHSLWRVDVSGECAALGTNDGSVKCWDLRCSQSVEETSRHDTIKGRIAIPDDRTPTAIEEETLQEESEGTSQILKKRKKAKPKVAMQVVVGMDFFQDGNNEHCLAVATRENSLFIFSLGHRVWNERQEWIEEAERTHVNANDGSCLSISSLGILAVGTTKGAVVLKHISGRDCCAVLDGQLFKNAQNLSWLGNDLLATFHIRGIVVLWDVRTRPLTATKLLVLNTTTNEIPTCVVALKNRRQYVAGDRRGNISFFTVDPDDAASNEQINATSVCRRLHAKEHVNSIACFEEERILSVGNDGFICECSLTDGTKLVRGTRFPIASLSGASRIWMQGGLCSPASFLVSGYFGNTFRVVSVADGYELLSIDTGGRQRQLSHVIHSIPGQAPLCGVAICASRRDGQNDLILYSSLQSSNRMAYLPSHGIALHGEPVYDACLFATRDATGYIALLSGSEDCTVKLTFLDKTGLRHSLSLPAQESCVRAVAASRRPKSDTTLVVVCGGKLVIDFYTVHDGNTATFSPAHVFVRQVGEGRIQDKAGIDHRVNAVAALPIGDSCSHLVVTGDSNGSVHCFIVQECGENMGSRITGTPFITEAQPILSLGLVAFRDHHLLFSGTTSGEVSMWLVLSNLERPASPLCVYGAHQMGTNSLCTLVLEENDACMKLLVASVGDDQALSVAEITISFDGWQCAIVSKCTTREACISALKGCAFISRNQLIIVGYGQRLAVWEWSHEDGSRLIRSVPIDVYDVNTLAYCNGLVAVGGEGIEIVELVEP